MLSCCLGWFDIFLGQNQICLLNENSVKKDVTHHLQWYGVTLVWISICLLRCVLLDKDLSHLEHWYGPEWILSIWFSRKIFFEYDLSHLEHENDSDSSGQLIIGAVYLDSKHINSWTLSTYNFGTWFLFYEMFSTTVHHHIWYSNIYSVDSWLQI